MTDHELLRMLFNFLARRTFVMVDKASAVDMAKRYQNPPLTRLRRVGMQMTETEYKQLAALLETIHTHLDTPQEESVG